MPNSLHDNLAASHPKLQRGQVWCRHCGYTETVSSSHALKHGWPKHCGYTMTIDPPEEWSSAMIALRTHLQSRQP